MVVGNEVLCQACGQRVSGPQWPQHQAAHAIGLLATLPTVVAFERGMHAGSCNNPRCPICAQKRPKNLEALALVLRGASHGAPLVLEGDWDSLTSAERERWLLFALRASDAVLQLQAEAGK